MENHADYVRFLAVFARSEGASEILAITALLSLGIGATISLIPSVTADRYARLHYDYTGAHCSLFGNIDKPPACQGGSDDAQEASTWSNVGLCVMLLMCNPVIASLSDSSGRRKMILASLVLAILPAAAFSCLLYVPDMSPFWFYAATSVAGSINFISLAFAALSDVMPHPLRAPAFGLIMAGFYGGFALGPTCSVVFLDPFDCSIVSTLLLVLALVLGILLLPETRQPTHSEPSLLDVQTTADDEETSTNLTWLVQTATRPLRDLSILSRNWTFRLLTAASFFSAMVFAADSTLVLYYIENQLGIQNNDLAQMFLVLGVFGIVCQGGLLQPLTKLMGDKPLLMATFLCGVCHNLVYGVAKTKYGITLAFIISQLTKLNFPLLSSVASRGASPEEQGRVQGALFATNAIANAIGPLAMEFIYRHTKSSDLGPGFMWIFAAFLYFVGAIIVTFIPLELSANHLPVEVECLPESASSSGSSDDQHLLLEEDSLEEPLLGSA